MQRITLLTLTLIFSCVQLSAVKPAYSEERKPLEISGYYKSLLNSTQTSDTKEGVFALTQRLRIKMKQEMDPWQFYLTLDNESTINDFSNNADFGAFRLKTHNNNANVDLDIVSADDDHHYLRHAIYRAYIKYYRPNFQATLGKQSIDWGKMRFYSPIDLFNAVSATSIEPSERMGVDALNIDFSPKAFTGINFVVAPGTDMENTKIGLKVYKTISTYDISAVIASIENDFTAGIAFDGYIKSAGFRGEITHNKIDTTNREFARVSVGIDYTFNEKLYMLVEQLYNGGADDNDVSALSASYKQARQLLSLQKNISNLLLNYKVTPLVDLDNIVLYDWDGESILYNPEIKYNLKSNIDISLGAQLYWGSNQSEFGSYEHLFYAEFEWFF